MRKHTTHALQSLLLLIGLSVLADVVRGQSSLIFKDSAGRTVEFTNFGTIVYPDLNVVSRGYGVVYGDGSTVKRAWYLNSLNNFGIIPVSLSADRPNGHILSDGEAVYVRARMKTADEKLEIICRSILHGGAPGIDAVVTVVNTSNSSADVGEFSLLTPIAHECQCPCEPVRAFDGATVQASIITIAPNTRYRNTKAVFTAPTLSRGASRDIPGCDPKPPIDLFPIR